jgi:hypothetical protein
VRKDLEIWHTSTATVAVPLQHSTAQYVPVRVTPYEGLVAAVELGIRCSESEYRALLSAGEEIEHERGGDRA